MKPIFLFYTFIVLTTFFSCNTHTPQQNDVISLQDWLSDEKNISQFHRSMDLGQMSCDSLKVISDSFKTNEFKKRTYLRLAECYEGNNKRVETYLLKATEGGFHPDRIDSVKFSAVYSNIKDRLYESYMGFWSERDTSYFSEIEYRVSQESFFNRKSIEDPTKINLAATDSVYMDNSRFLLDFSKENGFPFHPSPSYFNSFRISIDPMILAMHSPDENRWKLLNYAIKSAENGENSWRIPISINISFFTSSKQRTQNSHPLWLTYFNENGDLDIENSYLQLYSIKKLYDQDMMMTIKIQPSKHNLSDKERITRQLEEIKKALISEFSFTPEQLIITDIPDTNEPDYREIAPYEFTLSVVR